LKAHANGSTNANRSKLANRSKHEHLKAHANRSMKAHAKRSKHEHLKAHANRSKHEHRGVRSTRKHENWCHPLLVCHGHVIERLSPKLQYVMSMF
jgi:hypothetical protein